MLFTAGLGLQLLAICYWLIDVQGHRRWTKPLVIFGVNALALYFLAGITARLLGVIRLAGSDGQAMDLKRLIVDRLFAWWLSPINASLAYAISFVLVFLGLMAILYRRNIVIKV